MANIKRANTSGITKSGSAISDVPDAPTIGAVADTAAGGTVTVAYTAATTGGAVTTFTATSTPGTITGTGASPITVTGLTDNTAYTFKVKGTNSTATGPESAASSSVTPTNFLVGAYDSIATTTLSTATASITFSSIPATYTHLQIRLTNLATVADNILLQYNGDTASNYGFHWLYGNGSAANAYASSSASNMALGYTASTTASYTGAAVIDVLDYANTSKYKTARSLNGSDDNSTGGYILFSSGLWRNTAAITSILIYPQSGNFKQYTSAALYGIRGA